MTSKQIRFRSISLTFRGFELTPQEVESFVGVTATRLGNRGEPVKPGVKTLLKRSVAKYSLEFPSGCRLDEMVPALMQHLGGISHLCNVRDRVSPEFFEIDIVLPIKGSEEQEGGFFPSEVIADLYNLRASLSFQFL